MRLLSRIELAALSQPQRSQIGAYASRWARLRLSTARVDRAAAEDGVQQIYQAAGLQPPTDIVWAEGPVAAAHAWVRERDQAGENLRALCVDMVRRKTEGAADRAIGLSVRMAMAAEPELARAAPFCATLDEAVTRDCERARPVLRSRIANLFKFSGRRLGLGFAASSIGFHSASWLGPLQYLGEVCGLSHHTAALQGLWQTAQNAGWMIPHERVCWLSERANLLRVDASGRLHAAKGPAVSYGDGWSAYAWKGVLVPPWLIERPDFITVRSIAAAHDPQIRRCMIDIFTPERFIAEGGAYRVSQDETGVLWRQRWRWEAWAAVEVVNGTPEPDGVRKHYFLQVPATMRSAREAVAWTYGLTEQRYRPVIRT